MLEVSKWIEDQLLITPNLQVQLVKTIFIILILTFLYFFIRKLLYKTIEDNKVYYRIKKTTSYIIVVIAFIMVGRVWFQGFSH